MKTIFTFLTLTIYIIATTKAQAQTINPTNHIIYVDSANTSSPVQDGSSWQNATTSLADALKWAKLNTSTWNLNETDSLLIWVAKGTYVPQYSPEDNTGFGDSTRDNSFLMIKNVKIYGGFNPAVNDTIMASRDWKNNITILSGDRGIIGDSSDNCYHVVVAAGDIDNSRLDGFTIKHGNANGSGTISINGFSSSVRRNFGGGVISDNFAIPPIYTSPLLILTNLIITENSAYTYGGGICNTNYIRPTLINVEITNNSSGNSGGGICNHGSSPILTNVTISNNSASSYGGGMSNFQNSSPTLTNVTILNNSASSGGGIANYSGSSPKLTHVSITDNSANRGGGIIIENSSPTLNHVAISNNSASVSGGGIYNNNSSPAFINTIITNNNATSEGGGIFNQISSPKLINVLVANNSVISGTCGGVYNYKSSPELTNATIINNNKANLYNVNYSNPRLHNCIIFGRIYNAPAQPGNGASTPIFSHSLYGGATTGENGNIDTTGISPNDIFVNIANGNYQLNPCTIVTNAGSNNLYNSSGGNLSNDADLGGNSRLVGDSIDMGAYESQSSLPDTTVDSSLSPDLMAIDNNAAYQWIDCGNGEMPISGETNQNFTATANGNYAVILTSPGGCVDTSICIVVTSLGIVANSFENALHVYPNPTKGQFSINLGKDYKGVNISITNVLGELIDYKEQQNEGYFSFTINEVDGVYFVHLISDNQRRTLKVVKQ